MPSTPIGIFLNFVHYSCRCSFSGALAICLLKWTDGATPQTVQLGPMNRYRNSLGSGVTSNFGPPARKPIGPSSSLSRRPGLPLQLTTTTPTLQGACKLLCKKILTRNFGPPRPAGPSALRGLRGHYLRHCLSAWNSLADCLA